MSTWTDLTQRAASFLEEEEVLGARGKSDQDDAIETARRRGRRKGEKGSERKPFIFSVPFLAAYLIRSTTTAAATTTTIAPSPEKGEVWKRRSQRRRSRAFVVGGIYFHLLVREVIPRIRDGVARLLLRYFHGTVNRIKRRIVRVTRSFLKQK
jgi:hypothetical protein